MHLRIYRGQQGIDIKLNYPQTYHMTVTLTHLEAPLVHAWRSSMVVSVLGVVGVTLLVVLMARRGRSSVTLGRSGSLHVRCVVLGGS